MDFEQHLRALLAPHAPGGVIAPGVTFVASAAELGLGLIVRVGSSEVHVEIARVEDGGRFAARTDRLVFRYRRGPAAAPVSSAEGLAACRAVAAIAAIHEAAVLGAIAEEARAGAVTEEGAERIREVHVSRLLVPSGAANERFHALSPYVGCLIGCRFCYAQARIAEGRRLAAIQEVPWGSFVDARVNAPEVLARELADLPALPVKFCPILSDPYQAAERRLRITRRCVEAFARAAPRPVLVLTRSSLVLRDLDVIAALPAPHVGFSIPTIDDDARRHFEPRAAPIAERFEALDRLRAAGVRTFAVVQPMLPGDVNALADALARSAFSVSIDVLRGTYAAASDFADPAFSKAADEGWQREAATELAEALASRGVPLWRGELPPDVLDG